MSSSTDSNIESETTSSSSDEFNHFPTFFPGSSSQTSQEINNIFNNWTTTLPQAQYIHMQAINQIAQMETIPPPKPKHKRIRKDRNREQWAKLLYQDYFAPSPERTFNDFDFRRRFRMRRPVFLRIIEDLTSFDPWFKQKTDAAGKLGFTELQKCTAAMRILAYGAAYDQVDEYTRVAASTGRQCLTHFVNGIVSLYGPTYLREPNQADLDRLLFAANKRGFPGMIGSIDCMHWEWKNCPMEWKGQFTGRDGHSTIVLEAVASYDPWIWHAFFGVPGSCNDINVLDRSPLFNNVLEGNSVPVRFEVNNNQYNMGYYLVDGIYPQWAAFIPSIRIPRGDKAKLFSQKQESYRKDVERAFGVLQSRFAIVRNPVLIWDINFLGKVMMACIILHNMIVEDERDTYRTYYDPSQFEQIGNNQSWQPNIGRRAEMAEYLQRRFEVRNKEYHKKLKDDLVEHVWHKYRGGNS